jgi:Tat protein translocase TatB subunit
MSLGPAEILVILVVALVVFGPKRLPEVSRQVGGAMRELRRMQDNIRDELNSVIHSDGGGDSPTPPVDGAPVHEIEAGADHDVHPDVHPDGAAGADDKPPSPPGPGSVRTVDDIGPSGSFS